MNSKTIKALRSSIAHWKRMRKNRKTGERPARASCALCLKFNPLGRAPACIGCPVKERTGKMFCKGSPFRQAEQAFWEGTLAEWRKAATAEIEFLESLLPKKGDR